MFGYFYFDFTKGEFLWIGFLFLLTSEENFCG